MYVRNYTYLYYSDYSDQENGGADLYNGEGVESGFEGAFDRYAAGARDPHDNIIAMATNAGHLATFQGVEPMGNVMGMVCCLGTEYYLHYSHI